MSFGVASLHADTVKLEIKELTGCTGAAWNCAAFDGAAVSPAATAGTTCLTDSTISAFNSSAQTVVITPPTVIFGAYCLRFQGAIADGTIDTGTAQYITGFIQETITAKTVDYASTAVGRAASPTYSLDITLEWQNVLDVYPGALYYKVQFSDEPATATNWALFTDSAADCVD